MIFCKYDFAVVCWSPAICNPHRTHDPMIYMLQNKADVAPPVPTENSQTHKHIVSFWTVQNKRSRWVCSRCSTDRPHVLTGGIDPVNKGGSPPSVLLAVFGLWRRKRMSCSCSWSSPTASKPVTATVAAAAQAEHISVVHCLLSCQHVHIYICTVIYNPCTLLCTPGCILLSQCFVRWR